MLSVIIVTIIIFNLFSNSCGLEDLSFKFEWSQEVIPLNKERDLTLSNNYPSTAWIILNKLNKMDHPHLAVERFSFDGKSRKICQVELNLSNYTTLKVENLVSMENDIEICTVNKYRDSNVEYSEIYILDMKDCKLTSVAAPSNQYKYTKLFPSQYDNQDTFEIFYHEEKLQANLCSNDTCRQTFDLKTHEWSNLLPFNLSRRHKMKRYFHINTMGRRSLDGGYYFLIHFSRSFYTDIYVASVTTSGELIDSLKIYGGQSEDYPMDSSYTHDLSGTCYVPEYDEKSVKCLQVDAKTNIMINRTYNFDNKVERLRVHNLKDGGFLLLTESCKIENCYDTFIRLTKTLVNGMESTKDIEKEHCNVYPNNKQTLGILEDSDQVCMIYRCYLDLTLPYAYSQEVLEQFTIIKNYIHVKCL